MYLRRLKLVNYGGIYNGLGLEEIEIDFTRCQHRIILVKVDNGSGKSTIVSALKPLPDDNISFIPGKNARKRLNTTMRKKMLYTRLYSSMMLFLRHLERQPEDSFTESTKWVKQILILVVISLIARK